uniref:UDP-glycosyltransferases domain-containing protein n=1 Tax=Percolomonas cosmopolitus TaxID=63605 RepID=A0A7S1PG93_9EUKA|mmetsp:Transcript_1485/g.5070  ORF Transcript_1485/g.5070 Transcript_1485/m.5070 type:complete len:646 (+) Transcript_1485:334-2271(+)
MFLSFHHSVVLDCIFNIIFILGVLLRSALRVQVIIIPHPTLTQTITHMPPISRARFLVYSLLVLALLCQFRSVCSNDHPGKFRKSSPGNRDAAATCTRVPTESIADAAHVASQSTYSLKRRTATADTATQTPPPRSILFLMPPTYSHSIGAFYIAKHYCLTRPHVKIDFFWHSKYFEEHDTHCNENQFTYWRYDNESLIDKSMKKAVQSAKWGSFKNMDLTKLMEGVEKIYEYSIDDILQHLETHKYDLIVTHLVNAAALDAAEAQNVPVILMYTPVVLGLGGVGNPLWMPSMSNPLESLIQAQSLRSRVYVLYETIFRLFPFARAMSKRLDTFRRARGLKTRGLSFGLEDKLKLVFSTWGVEYPRSVVPLVQMIGTPFLNAVRDASKLSSDPYRFHLDLLKEDEFCVLVSFGSFVQLNEDFVKPILDGLLAAHEGLHVLFVDRSGMMETNNPRITIRKWIDQRGILSHPKVRVFMTHCGSKGFVEGVLNEKPLIAFPFLGDQPLTAQRAVEKGVAILLQREHATKEHVTEVVQEVLKREEDMKSKLARLKNILSVEDGVVNAARWFDLILDIGDYDHLKPSNEASFIVRHHLDLLVIGLAGVVGVLVGAVLMVLLGLRVKRFLAKGRLLVGGTSSTQAARAKVE